MGEPMRSTQVASKDATPTGSVHKSREDRVICMCIQLNRCCVFLFCIEDSVYTVEQILCVSVLHSSRGVVASAPDLERAG